MPSSPQLNCKKIIDQYYNNFQDDPQQIEGVLQFLKSGIIINGNNGEGAIEVNGIFIIGPGLRYTTRVPANDITCRNIKEKMM